MAPPTPKAENETSVEDVIGERLSTDSRDSTYAADDSEELEDQNPPHGPQVIQTLGKPKDHGKGS